MDQGKVSAQTRVKGLLRHYDMKDFIKFLVKKKYLSSSEVESNLSCEDAAIAYIISKDNFHTRFLKIVKQYSTYVYDDTTKTLTEINKLSIGTFKQELPCNIDHIESDSISSSSFSDDSDTGVNAYSQEISTESTECSGLLPDTDPGYFTQSNTSQSLSDPQYTCPLMKFSEEKGKPKRQEAVQHSRRSRTKIYNITNNYNNCKCYMAESAKHRKQLPLFSRDENHQTEARDTKRKIHSTEYHEDIGKFIKALQTCNFELTECLNVQSLLPYLQQEGLLTPNEYEKLSQTNKTSREQNQYLLGILPSKGEHACKQFIRCLSLADGHSGHAHLIALLTSVV